MAATGRQNNFYGRYSLTLQRLQIVEKRQKHFPNPTYARPGFLYRCLSAILRLIIDTNKWCLLTFSNIRFRQTMQVEPVLFWQWMYIADVIIANVDAKIIDLALFKKPLNHILIGFTMNRAPGNIVIVIKM